MISISFEQAVGFYIVFFVVVFLGGIFYSFFKKRKSLYHKEFKLWQCAICAFVYSSEFDLNMTVCPQCGSYNKREVEA